MASQQTMTPGASLPPPRMTTGKAGWVRNNLFSSPANGVTTVVVAALTLYLLWLLVSWAFGPADWSVIPTLGGTLILGQYNSDSVCPSNDCFWRPQASLLIAVTYFGILWAVAATALVRGVALTVAFASAAMALIPLPFDEMGMDVRFLLVANIPAVFIGRWLGRNTPVGSTRNLIIIAFVGFITVYFLLRGIEGVPGLYPVPSRFWGGLMLNILLAAGGITASLPLGILLALGRRSNLPVVKIICVGFIEFFRGVPLITLLFMSQTLVPLAFPRDFPLDEVTRAGIVITVFSSAYMAENIRGGLQALHRGQTEASRALGMPPWNTTIFITLPQALRNVVPAIVGQYISLFKDTTLVFIIGMLDILHMGTSFIGSNREFLDNSRELFLFIALVFWVFNYGMSYVSRRVEHNLGVGQR